MTQIASVNTAQRRMEVVAIGDERFMQQRFKIPPSFNCVPRFGNLLNTRYCFEVEVGGGWTIKVDANDSEQAMAIARKEGYTPCLTRNLGTDA